MSELFTNKDQQTLASGHRYHGQVHTKDERLNNNNMGNIKSALEYMLGGFQNAADIEKPLESSYDHKVENICNGQPVTINKLPELNYESETISGQTNRLEVTSSRLDYQAAPEPTQQNNDRQSESFETELSAGNESDDYDEEYEPECASDVEHSDYKDEDENEVDPEELFEYEEYTEEEDEASGLEWEERDEGEWSCTSECEEECDGKHHACDEECDCEEEHGQSENEDDEIFLENDEVSENEPYDEIQDTLPRIEGSNNDNYHGIHTSHERLGLSTPTVSTDDKTNSNKSPCWLKPELRSVSNKDIMTELKTAIDTRVKRTSSLREMQSSDSPRVCKRNASMPDTSENPSEYLKQLDVTERDTRRKERRARLRTLELKREAFLDELREGHERGVHDSLYKSSESSDSTYCFS